MNNWILLAVLGFSLLVMPQIPVHAQTVTIPVNQTDPCFLNYTAGHDMWENCGADDDYLEFALMGWQWITGGYFSMILVSMFIMVSYIKYHKAIYPIMIGVMFMPVSLFLFPEVFVTWAVMLTIGAATVFVWYAFIRQTKEF